MSGFRNPIIAGSTLVRDAIQSPNYVPGVSGWRLAKDGTAEFGALTSRGDITLSDTAGTPFSLQQWITWQSTFERTLGRYAYLGVSTSVNSSTPTDLITSTLVFDSASNPFGDNNLYYEFICEFDVTLTTAPSSGRATLVLELWTDNGSGYAVESDQAIWSTTVEADRITMGKTWRFQANGGGAPLSGDWPWKLTGRISGGTGGVYRVLTPHTVAIERMVGSENFG